MPLSRPGSAPPRPDLPWLRRRRPAPAGGGEPGRLDYTHPRRTRAAAVPPPAAPPAPSLDLPAALAPPAPPAAPSLDLSAAPPPAAGGLPRGPAPSLELPSPQASSLPERPAGPLSLELPPRAAPPARPPAPRRRRTRKERLPYPRVAAGATAVLLPPRPTVTLTRLQSGVGQLAVQLLRGPAAGDLAMGMVYETADGVTHVVQRPEDAAATAAAPLPLVRMTADRAGDRFLVDLRWVRSLRRALFYGYSPSVSVLAWDGLVVVGLHDGSRLEAPFDLPPLSGTVALLTVYAVEGELVLRAEREPYAGPPEAAALAYGYSHGWLDGRIPLT